MQSYRRQKGAEAKTQYIRVEEIYIVRTGKRLNTLKPCVIQRKNMSNIYDIIVDIMTVDNIDYCPCHLCERRDR